MATQDTTELLAQLRGIHIPEAPAEPHIWPVILAVAVLALVSLGFIIAYMRGRTSWYKQANRELENIKRKDNTQAVQNTAVLLKRIAITHDEQPGVKHLHGEKWLHYLDSFYSTNYFSKGDGQVFGDAQYRSPQSLKPEVFAEIKRLIRRKAKSQVSTIKNSQVAGSQ